MVEGELRSPTSKIRVWSLFSLDGEWLDLLTWDQVGPLGESGGSSVRKDGESDVVSQDLQCRSPSSMSVKDRWVGPREQVLNVLITC
jgi:hypothetical protein